MKKLLLFITLFVYLWHFSISLVSYDRKSGLIGHKTVDSRIGEALPRNFVDTIIASEIAPGYNTTNATACFVNAIKSAKKGDTVIIDYKPGTNGVWNIEGRHPHWFDGNSGKDWVAED